MVNQEQQANDRIHLSGRMPCNEEMIALGFGAITYWILIVRGKIGKTPHLIQRFNAVKGVIKPSLDPIAGHDALDYSGTILVDFKILVSRWNCTATWRMSIKNGKITRKTLVNFKAEDTLEPPVGFWTELYRELMAFLTAWKRGPQLIPA